MTNNSKVVKLEAGLRLPELAIALTANHATIATLYERDVALYVTFNYTPEQHASGSLLTGDYQAGEAARVDLLKVKLLMSEDLGIEDDDTFKLRIKADADLMQVLTRTQLQMVEDAMFKLAPELMNE